MERCFVIKTHLDAIIVRGRKPERLNSLPVHAPLSTLEYFTLWLCYSPIVYNQDTLLMYNNTSLPSSSSIHQWDAVMLLYGWEEWQLFVDPSITHLINPLFLQLLLFTWTTSPARLMNHMKSCYSLSLDGLLTKLYREGNHARSFHTMLMAQDPITPSSSSSSYSPSPPNDQNSEEQGQQQPTGKSTSNPILETMSQSCNERPNLLKARFRTEFELEFTALSKKATTFAKGFKFGTSDENNDDDGGLEQDLLRQIPTPAEIDNFWYCPNDETTIPSPYRLGSWKKSNVIKMYEELFNFDGIGRTDDMIEIPPTLTFWTLAQTMDFIDQFITTPEYNTLENLSYNSIIAKSTCHLPLAAPTLNLPPDYTIPLKYPSDQIINETSAPSWLRTTANEPKATGTVDFTSIFSNPDQNKLKAFDDYKKSNRVINLTFGNDDNNNGQSDEQLPPPIFYTGLLYFCIDAVANPSIDDIITLLNGLTIEVPEENADLVLSLSPTATTTTTPSDHPQFPSPMFLPTPLTAQQQFQRDEFIAQGNKGMFQERPQQQNSNLNGNNETLTQVVVLEPTAMTTFQWESPQYPSETIQEYIVMSSQSVAVEQEDENATTEELTPNEMPISMLIATTIRAITRRVPEPILCSLLNALLVRGEIDTLFNYSLWIRRKMERDNVHSIGATAMVSSEEELQIFQPKFFSTSLTLWQLCSAAGYYLPDVNCGGDDCGTGGGSSGGDNQQPQQSSQSQSQSFVQQLVTLYAQSLDQ